MAIKIAGIVLLSVGCALAQYNSIYIGPNTPDLDYDKTRQEIVQNFLNNKPLLSYVPVYNTEYNNWEEGKDKCEENAIRRFHQTSHPEPDFGKFSEIITRLKTNMLNLSHKTKHIYEDKLKELSEVKKLYDNLKVALQNTDVLKNNLQQNQKQLIELAKNQPNLGGYPSVSPTGVEQFQRAIEGLESMARNFNYKYDGKPRM